MTPAAHRPQKGAASRMHPRSSAPLPPVFHLYLQTKFGPVRASARMEGLCAVAFVPPWDIPSDAFPEPSACEGPATDAAVAVLQAFTHWLRDYEARRFRPPDFPLHHSGNPSEFARRVLSACAAIPVGETRTYAGLAEAAGFSSAHARAAAGVMARNTLPIVIPCHRVVAASGIGGYGPGIALKQKLLAHEGAFVP